MKIVFIINARSRRSAKTKSEIQAYFSQALPSDLEIIITGRKKHAIELASEAVVKSCDYIIAVGGDGTLHEVINGILHSGLSAENLPAIGLLPYGSANDFARAAGITKSFDKLAGLIRKDSVHKIDAGKIVLEETGETRFFINIAGVGLGPEVARNIENSSSVFGPRVNYFSHILKGFIKYRKKEVHSKSSEWQWKGPLLQMAIANGKYFGNGICPAPDATLNDAKFHVAVFGNLSIWDYLKNLRNLKKGIKINHPEVSYFSTEELIMESTENCGIEADGEYIGLLPGRISILPKALRFIMPG